MAGRGGLLEFLCCIYLCTALTQPRPQVTRTWVVDQYGRRIGASAEESPGELPLIACASMERDKEGGEAC